MTETQISSPQTSSSARTRARLKLQARLKRAWPALAVLILGPALGFAWSEHAAHGLPVHARMLGKDVVALRGDLASLYAAARERERVRIELHSSTATAALTAQQAGLSIDVDETLRVARRDYAASSIALRFARWARGLFDPLPEVRLVVREDAQRLDLALSGVEKTVAMAPYAGGFRVVGRDIVPDYPKPGSRLDRGQVRSALLHALATQQTRIAARTQSVPAPLPNAAIDRLVGAAKAATREAVRLLEVGSGRSVEVTREVLLAALRVNPPSDPADAPELAFDPEVLKRELSTVWATLEHEPVAARFTIDAQDHVHIVPGITGARLDLGLLGEATLAAASNPERVARLPLSCDREAEPSTAALRDLGVRGLVSSFTTRHPCCEARVANIHRIADLLDGVIVKPGETFSVNALVGPRTQKNGFVPAPTIEEGEMVETLGGGISQFATTLFNAVFHGGYEIIERQPHSYWFPRYPMGHEATLSYPKPDLIFRNDTQAGVLIDTQYTDKSITVRL
ncbi:MAG TPA: VanW family protein, partial [Polyangiaceae bacterium]|nr:VanW family protein [Polyangiaceae bacterium]